MTKVEVLQVKLLAIARAANERRRPGRPETVHRSLVGLLRGPAAVLPAETTGVMAITDLPVDDRRVAKGISAAALISAALWSVIGTGVWLLYA